ncbi:uncharacterized protein LOC100839049 isoform X2 [Brachypodium distachyon]|uniref:PHD-type domain-containing protein n=1 Tax=Brachypodium distachyon TaxID=15368 RepID=I1J3U0_BRADI|nr:uncharacterized protein LOC100839049 isoform X2 [Brachypodium distachyon]KQJ85507.1 hypothetical protein BRADI_5g27517v3 [Brachypodium distachyon]PNT62237.1 hypothetical protein BRADI_5g27517v3 [Brachypodium distachyon]|eukprot:XP_003579549.1 uncharacterized protein LOC100839049 isoform X2 [Brachypodium distachyon]
MSGEEEEALGFREDDALRFIFGDSIAGMDDDAGFDRSLVELRVFKEVFSSGVNHHLHPHAHMEGHFKVAETSLLSSLSAQQQQPADALQAGVLDTKVEEPPRLCSEGIETDRMDARAARGAGEEHAHSHGSLDGTVDPLVEHNAHCRSELNGVDELALELDAALQGFLGYWPDGPRCATDDVVGGFNQQQVFRAAVVGNNADVHMQAMVEDSVAAGLSDAVGFGCSTSTSGVDDPMPSYMDALADFSRFQSDTSLSDPFLYQWLHDQQPFPSDASCLSYDQGQIVDTSQVLYTYSGADLSERGAEEYPFYNKSAHDTAMPPRLSNDCIGSGQFVELDNLCEKGTPDPNTSSLDDVDVPQCSNLQSVPPVVGSKRTLSRDLPDQLEAHAHCLFIDAGWTIKPRKRNDRAKMASYFTAPHREVVLSSLTQAWKFCGNKLYEASVGSERGKHPKEWSDVDTFWKDLTDTMECIQKILVNQQNALTLLQRWELLDPFIAVVFISRKVTALQQCKTLRAVDSSTFVLDDNKQMSSESKSTQKASNSSTTCMVRSTPVITESDCSARAIETCNRSQALQSSHDLKGGLYGEINLKSGRTQGQDCEASDRTENRIKESTETRQVCSGAKLVNNSVKKARKKPEVIPYIDANCLDGLYAQSFMQHTMENIFNQENNVAILDFSNPDNINLSGRHSICPAVGTLKKHLRAESRSAKLSGNNQINKPNVLFPSESKQMSMLRGDTVKEPHTISEPDPNERVPDANEIVPVEMVTISEPDSNARESDANEIVTIEMVHKNLPSSKESSLGIPPKDSHNVPTDSAVPLESCHESNAALLKTDLSRESQICKTVAAKRKPEGCDKYAKKRPRELRINDDDLLIAAIVKNRDAGSYHKFAAGSSFSVAKKFKSQKRGSKLFVRTCGKGGTNLLGGKRISLARKTVLCWLIATGFLTVKDVIQYRNLRSNEVIKDGQVTWEGILCNCCTKTLSISDFKAHAGCRLRLSSLGLFLQSGKSYTLCQVEAWSAELMSRRSDAYGRKVEAVDENDDTCGFCGDGGELLCCDNCPSTYHEACLSSQELPEGSWYCHNCTCRSCGNPVNEKEVSSFSDILKCLQCGDAYHNTCIDRVMLPSDGKRSDTWFCGRYCKEIFMGLHSQVGVENVINNDLSWTILRCNSDGQRLHSAQKIGLMTECNTKLAVALTLLEECFIRMVDPRTGVDMIPHVLYNKGSNFARLDYKGFYTVILEKGDEILCVASIRLHGTKAAELPFIATSVDYRRQGMCRRLLDIIEKMLRSFHVEMLVLSAIPELVNTWVSGFGFKPIEDDEKKQLRNVNLMLFPGASLLTKRFDGIITAKPEKEKGACNVSVLTNDKCLPNGKANEHLVFHELELPEKKLNSEVEMNGSFRTLKHECGPAAWFNSAKLTVGEV